MRVTPRELRGQLIILAVVLWGVAAVNSITPTWRLRSGQIKGTDFVHFYTLARLGAEGRADAFADIDELRRTQIAAFPESTDDWFPPAYGPQVALLLTPLGYFTYGHALVLWLIVTAVGYAWLIRLLLRRGPLLGGHTDLCVLAAVAFPPFWNLIQHGQLSIIALTVYVFAWLAVRRGSTWSAGAILGLLAYKPSLAVPTLAILLLAGEWRMVVGAIVIGCGQLVLASVWTGFRSIVIYGRLLGASPRLAALLTAQPTQLHSWRGFWLLLMPDSRAGLVLYSVMAMVTIAIAAITWRRLEDANLRMATLIIATVLSSPHVYGYDLVVLAPVWIWLVEWYLARPDLPAAVGRTLYAGFFAPLLGLLSTVTRIQVSTLCLALVLGWIWRKGPSPAPSRSVQPLPRTVAEQG